MDYSHRKSDQGTFAWSFQIYTPSMLAGHMCVSCRFRRGKNLFQNIRQRRERNGGETFCSLRGLHRSPVSETGDWWSPWEGETFFHHSFPVFVWCSEMCVSWAVCFIKSWSVSRQGVVQIFAISLRLDSLVIGKVLGFKPSDTYTSHLSTPWCRSSIACYSYFCIFLLELCHQVKNFTDGQPPLASFLANANLPKGFSPSYNRRYGTLTIMNQLNPREAYGLPAALSFIRFLDH